MIITKQYYVSNKWALASDNIQWILQHKRGKLWEGLIFITTEKSILERCMRDKGVPSEDHKSLMAHLEGYETFNEWRATHLPINENNECFPPLNAVKGHSNAN